MSKAGHKTSEEATLVKMFKFFDILNLGQIDFPTFCKSMEKLGLSFPEDKLKEVFDECDQDQSGTLNYREFVVMFLGEEAAAKGQVAQVGVGAEEMKQLLDQLRRNVIKRGAKGIIGLQRVFKICDDDNSGELNRSEFFKAMK